MTNNTQQVIAKFWKMSLYLPRMKDSLIATVGKERDINDWFSSKAKIIKSDTHSQVGLLETETLGQIYIKRYRTKSWWHRLALLFGSGRPVKNFKMSLLLSERGMPVPTPYGLITARGCLGFPGSSYYLCQGLVGGEDLKSFYLASSDNGAEIIKDCLQRIGRLLAEFHNCGYLHGDCKWSNILLQGAETFFVDLDNAGKNSSPDAQAKDLARFILNAEELAIGKQVFDCFINAYCETRSSASAGLMDSCKTQLEKLRVRHLARYGERGERLMD